MSTSMSMPCSHSKPTNIQGNFLVQAMHEMSNLYDP
jgi:hypothetical protein